MASIREHRNKWQVQVRRAGHPPVSRSFIQKTDAMAWARQVERKIDGGELVADLGALNRVLVRDLLIRYKDTIAPLKRGAKAESHKIVQLLRHGLAECSLRGLTLSVIARYRDERLLNVRPGTVLRELAILRHCFKVARREWDIPISVNPVSQITMPKASKPRERRVTSEEMEALFRGCDRGQSALLKPIISFAVETGMRRGEIVAMRWTNIDVQCKTLLIPITKNGHARTIPLTPVALEILNKLPRDDERIFPISGNAIRLAWGRLKKRVGVVNLRFHDLRHEAISRFFEMGLSVPEVALISGHKDTRMLF